MSFRHTSVAATRKKDKSPELHPFLRRHTAALAGQFGEVQTEDRVEFRASGLPFCALIHTRKLALKQAGPSTKYKADWSGEFYTRIGTALHEHWQNVLAQSSLETDRRINVKMFGSWKCDGCKRELTDRFMPKNKCTCKANVSWNYIETEMEYRGLSMHVDCIEYYPDEDSWVISDLKTAGADNVDKPERLEIAKNTFQIEAYCVIFEKLFGKRPSHYCLFYQTRDKAGKYYPHFVEWTDARRADAIERLERWCDTFPLTAKYIANPSAETLVPMIEDRPCFTKGDYDREMAPSFKWDVADKTSKGKICRFYELCTKHNDTETIARKMHSLIRTAVIERKLGKADNEKIAVATVTRGNEYEREDKERLYNKVMRKGKSRSSVRSL